MAAAGAEVLSRTIRVVADATSRLRYTIEATADDSELTCTLYDSEGTEVSSLSTTDSTYEFGAVGLWTYDYYGINYASYIDVEGSEAPSPTSAPTSNAPTTTLAPTPEGYTTFCSASNSYEVVQGDGTYGNTYDGYSCLHRAPS